MLTNEQEKILQFLLSLPRDNTNRITVSRKKYNLDYSESDFLNKLRDIETLGYFEIKYLTCHHDTLKTYIEIIPNGSMLYYFEKKKELQRAERNNWIQFWIPVSLSIIAIAISIVALILGQ